MGDKSLMDRRRRLVPIPAVHAFRKEDFTLEVQTAPGQVNGTSPLQSGDGPRYKLELSSKMLSGEQGNRKSIVEELQGILHKGEWDTASHEDTLDEDANIVQRPLLSSRLNDQAVIHQVLLGRVAHSPLTKAA